MKRHIKDQLLAARANETAVALVTDLTGGEQSLLTETSFQGDLALESDALDQARSMLHDERSGSLAAGERRLFVRVYSLPWRMVVVGAVHITQHLSPMATMAGYAVTIVDPRQAFATADRFPGQRLNTQWPDELFAAEPPDRHTAIVTLTHDPKIDDPALEVALRSPAFLSSARWAAARPIPCAWKGWLKAASAPMTSPASMPPSASTWAAGRRPRSPSPSWLRSSRRAIEDDDDLRQLSR